MTSRNGGLNDARVLIIGAGPAGLGAAWRLRELGHRDFLILEASDHVGGLASSHLDSRGFLWDEGGHVEYSHYPYFDEAMRRALAPEDWLHHQRAAWIRLRGVFVPYPFQNNIRHLPEPELGRCLRGLDELRRDGPPPRDFLEWTVGTFGRGIADVFMLPYNRKVWAYPLDRMGHQWVGERVSVPDPARIRENVRLGRDDVGWGANSTFRFPRRGGTGAIWNAVADLIGRDNIRLRQPVRSVDPARKTVLTDAGAERFDLVFNTMPLDAFAARVQGLPEEIARLCAGLRHTTTHALGIGVEGRLPSDLAGKYWIYFPEDEVPFYRAEVYSNFSPHNVPDPDRHWSFLAEASESPGKTLEPGPLLDEAVRAMLREGWIDSERQVVSRWHHRAGYGYPVPTLDRDAVLSAVQPILEGMSLFSRGRFGGWKYEAGNQDHAFMQGVEWADLAGAVRA